MTETVCRLRHALALGCLMLLGVGSASPALLAQQRVGVDSAVNPAAMGIPPGGAPKRLVLGQDVVRFYQPKAVILLEMSGFTWDSKDFRGGGFR